MRLAERARAGLLLAVVTVALGTATAALTTAGAVTGATKADASPTTIPPSPCSPGCTTTTLSTPTTALGTGPFDVSPQGELSFGTFSPSALPAPKQVVLKANTTLTVTSILLASSTWLTTSGCTGQTLNSGDNCTLTVSMTPPSQVVQGLVPGNPASDYEAIQVAWSIPQGVQTVPVLAAQVSATLLIPANAITITPQQLSFGNVFLYTWSAPQVVTVKAQAPLATVCWSTSDFAFDSSPTCAGPFATGDSYPISVRFGPKAAIAYGSTLNVRTQANAGVCPCQSVNVPLTGTGIVFSATQQPGAFLPEVPFPALLVVSIVLVMLSYHLVRSRRSRKITKG